MSLTPRQGTSGRTLKLKEVTAGVSTWGTDPVTPVKYLVPLAGADAFKAKQPRNPAKIYDGRRSSKGSYLGMIDASGDMPVSLDFSYAGVDIDCHMGHDVYTRVGSLHRWAGQGSPIPFQLQHEHQETPLIVHRHRGIYSTIFRIAQQMSGQAMYTVSNLGKGDEVRTDVGGSVTDYSPFVAYNYFNGAIIKDGVSLATVVNFSLDINNNVSRKDAAFHSGQGAAVNLGMPTVEGDLGMIFTTEDGDTFYDQAINDTIVSLECYYTDKPLTAGPTQWLRFIIPAVLFSRDEPMVGGEVAEDQTQHYIAQVPKATDIGDLPAESFGSTIGPWTIPGGASIYVKIDGTLITVAVSAGVKTAAQIATILNADGTFSAAAVASDFNGRLKVQSKSKVYTVSKVQFQTGAGDVNTLLGLSTTIFSGVAASMIYIELYNGLTADY